MFSFSSQWCCCPRGRRLTTSQPFSSVEGFILVVVTSAATVMGLDSARKGVVGAPEMQRASRAIAHRSARRVIICGVGVEINVR